MSDLLTTIGILLLGALGAFFMGKRSEQKKTKERREEAKKVKEAVKKEVETQDDQGLIDLISRPK